MKLAFGSYHVISYKGFSVKQQHSKQHASDAVSTTISWSRKPFLSCALLSHLFSEQ